MIPGKTFLVLAPHTDDGELGCGATISALLEAGRKVHYAAFSTAAASLPRGSAPDQLRQEVVAATAALGIDRDCLHLFDYEVRTLGAHRQAILDDIIGLSAALRPDVVFVPSRADVHQDHATVTSEALRAFKNRTVLGYELPWNNLTFDADCFVVVEERHLRAKLGALAEYRTQRGRDYMRPDFIRALARVRGTQIGVSYAETFEVVRTVF